MTRPVPDAKVVFPLTPDEFGWPPAASEKIWATSLGEDRYRISNAPFLVPNIAVDDVVLARTVGVPTDAGADAEPLPVFVEVLEPSEHVTLRLIVQDPTALSETAEQLTALGVWVEGFPHYSMLAVDVPPGLDFDAVARAVDEGQRAGRWDWEEGRITARWVAATSGF